MKRTLAFTLALLTTSALSGCLVRTHNHGHGKQAKACHPSQHWDGQQCKHNGKGHGARKHDGRKK